ncbi:adenylate cyclase [Tistlia consotensis]|uniref:Adenylate cyclase n=1 Tax=Tistlia consotensis USBA 355 TaxID=560819 RepID=A0A1Y6CHW3_9PROT|nr:adenylate/guanylate cyclase domain-containing protein [Tistlia consotensis]SMF55786.1 adenylate cyclase [Tistlia consotensis USBA 355]SNR89298.1 adenylate cyclase [Tistlia consotensis]
MSEQSLSSRTEKPALGAIAEWLERTALKGLASQELVGGLAERMVAAGIPLGRMTAMVDTLHPVHEGSVFRWVDGEAGGEAGADTMTYGRDYDVTRWQATTYYHLERHGLEDCRWRLRPGEEPELAALCEFRDAGFTDYLVVVERFEDSGSVGEMTCIYSSWMTRAPEGFSDAAIATIRRLSPVLALALKCNELQSISTTIAETYLGRNAAARVMEGGILRGVASEIKAVLWSSDLMSFTAHSEALEPAELIPFLNAYSGALVEAIRGEGGDVLKFMGDGLLAIFPAGDDPAAACRAALRAEREARRLVAALNETRAAEGRRTTDFYLALHLGYVYFGNIGSADRLDFTVIGPAVNEAARIMALCSSVRRPLLLSARFAGMVADDDLPLASVGRFALRGVSEAQHLYTLA